MICATGCSFEKARYSPQRLSQSLTLEGFLCSVFADDRCGEVAKDGARAAARLVHHVLAPPRAPQLRRNLHPAAHLLHVAARAAAAAAPRTRPLRHVAGAVPPAVQYGAQWIWTR